MKTQRAIFSGVLAIGLAAAPQAVAGGSGRTPFPSGHFSLTVQGTEASCSGASCITLNIIEVGSSVRDGQPREARPSLAAQPAPGSPPVGSDSRPDGPTR